MTTATTSDAMPSGADLLLRIGEGDPAAWEQVMRRYGKLVSVTSPQIRQVNRPRSSSMAEQQEYDVIVLGGGSTGENAAWYARRNGLSAVVVEAS